MTFVGAELVSGHLAAPLNVTGSYSWVKEKKNAVNVDPKEVSVT